MERIKIADEQELNHIKIYCCDTERVKKSCVYGPTIRNHHLIHYVFSGKGKIYLYGHWYECKAGSIIWIPPYNPVTYIADSTNPWHYAWIGIAGGESSVLYNELYFSLQNPCRNYKSNNLERLFVELANVYRDDHVVARLNTLSVFYKIVNELSDVNDVQEDEVSNLLKNALEIIRNNYWKNPRIENVATELGVDRSYLYRIFKEQLGVSPKRFLDDYRLSVAFELLRSGNYSVVQVSQAVGYGSVTTFSKVFRDKYAMSPSEHMRQQRGIK